MNVFKFSQIAERFSNVKRDGCQTAARYLVRILATLLVHQVTTGEQVSLQVALLPGN